MYIRIHNTDPRYVFIDHCSGASKSINNRFRYFDKSLMSNLRKNDDLPFLACGNTSLPNESNQNEWNQIALERNYFKCAKLSASPCNENYVVSYKQF